MEYENYTELLDTIIKLAIREKDLPSAIKCAELKLKHDQLQHSLHDKCDRPMRIEDLSEEQIVSMINKFEIEEK